MSLELYEDCAMNMHANEPGLVEVGLTVAAFAICAWAAGGPLVAAITAVLVLVAISRGRQRRRAGSHAANDNVPLRNVLAMNQREVPASRARNDNRFDDRAAAA
jgi:hypothetical protein